MIYYSIDKKIKKLKCPLHYYYYYYYIITIN